MNQKERALLSLKAMVKGSSEGMIHTDFLAEKIEAMLTMSRPEILLGETERKLFDALVEKRRREGKML